MLRSLLLLAATVLAGLHAGFFFTWSFTVMNGLDAAEAQTAIAAMQSMNANIRNAPFGIVFFGAPAVALIAAITLVLSRRGLPALLTIIGFAGLAATVALTAGIHIPLNEALALQDIPATPDKAGSMWRDYSVPWTTGNHARAATSLTGFLFLLFAFRLDRNR